MRLPGSFSRPPLMLPGWLVAVVGGGVVLLLLLLFALAFPWGSGPVAAVELPRARLLETWRCDSELPHLSISVDENGAIWIDGQGRVVLPDVERLVRTQREGTEGRGNVVLLLHRQSRWRWLRGILEAGARAGQSRFHVRMARGAGQTHLLLVLDGEVEAPVVLDSLEDAGERSPAAVRLALDGDPAVETVLQALEARADGGTVTLVGIAGG